MFKITGLVCVLGCIFLNGSAMAENNNFIFNGAPLHVITNTNKDFIISNCQQFIALRQSGEKINTYGGLPDPDYREAKETLFHCYLEYYARQHGFTAVKTPGPSLSAILHHFPASAALAISNEEVENVKKNYAGKSMFDYTLF